MATLGQVTIPDVQSFEPCDSDSARRIEELFAGRETINAFDILAMDMPFEHKMWLIMRPELIDQDTLNLIGDDFLALMTDADNVFYQRALVAPKAGIINKFIRYSGQDVNMTNDFLTMITNVILNRIQ